MAKQYKQQRRGVSYGRVSTLSQTTDDRGNYRDDASPAAQKIRCHEHAEYLEQRSKIQHQIVEHISDEGFSAKNVNRPGYQRLWRLIESEQIDFVIASELSRISRSVTDFLELVSHCKDHKVDIIVIGLELDTSSPFGQFMVVILVALAQFEREMTSMRVRENALTRLINDGKINGGAELLGLKRDPDRAGHFLPDAEELAQVETLMLKFLEVPGKAQLLREAKKLGLKTKAGDDLKMHGLTILLENARWRYRGLWPANKENKDQPQEDLPENKRYVEVELPHGPLLDLKLLEKVTKKVEASRTRITSGKDAYIYLLSGILRDEDGNKFNGQHGKEGKYRYYYNRKTRERLKCEDVDKAVFRALKNHILDENKFRELVKEGYQQFRRQLPSFDDNIAELKRLEKKLNRDEMKIRQSFSAENLDNPAYTDWLKEQVTEITSEKTRIRDELVRFQEKRTKLLSEEGYSDMQDGLRNYLDHSFDSLPRGSQREILQKIVPAVFFKNFNQLEIRLASPEAELADFDQSGSLGSEKRRKDTFLPKPTGDRVTPYDKVPKELVTTEEKSCDLVWNGGRDGT